MVTVTVTATAMAVLVGGWLTAPDLVTAAAAPPAPVVPVPPVSPAPVTPSLEVSATTGLDPAGATVTVTGSGYDVNRGIYVAFCVVPPPGGMPTPCGGGIDLEGATGASQWISSAPPDYGLDLAQIYGPDGSFQVQLGVSAVLSQTIDCRMVQCAVVTRADHTRLTDRSLDVIVPVFFDAVSPAPEPTITAPLVPAAPVPAAPVVPAAPADASNGSAPDSTADSAPDSSIDSAAGSELPAARGATATWPVWAGSAGVALGLFVLAPKRRSGAR
jgi:hypothetical protein